MFKPQTFKESRPCLTKLGKFEGVLAVLASPNYLESSASGGRTRVELHHCFSLPNVYSV